MKHEWQTIEDRTFPGMCEAYRISWCAICGAVAFDHVYDHIEKKAAPNRYPKGVIRCEQIAAKLGGSNE